MDTLEPVEGTRARAAESPSPLLVRVQSIISTCAVIKGLIILRAPQSIFV